MRLMRHPACTELIRGALASADETIWTALAGEHGIVSKSESMVKAGARLPGDLRFGIESQYGTLENWLSANARATARAWYRSRFSEVRNRRADPPAYLRGGRNPLALAARIAHARDGGRDRGGGDRGSPERRLPDVCGLRSPDAPGHSRAAGHPPAPHAFRQSRRPVDSGPAAGGGVSFPICRRRVHAGGCGGHHGGLPAFVLTGGRFGLVRNRPGGTPGDGSGRLQRG